MKYMTNAQIDELNLLLDKHGAALTAFYNEGMRQGAKNVILSPRRAYPSAQAASG